MNEYDTALLQRTLHDLAEQSRPPHGLAAASLGRAQRRRRRQSVAAGAAALTVLLGIGGLTSVLTGTRGAEPGTSPTSPLPSGSRFTVTARPDTGDRVLGRMPRAVAVVRRGSKAYGIDAAGRETPLVRLDAAATDAASLSPDGTLLAVPGSAMGDYRVVGLWLLDLATGRARVLPVGGDQLMGAFWSPDGRSVLSERYGGGQVYVIRVDSGVVQAVPRFAGDVAGWAPDGRRILAADNVPVAAPTASGSAGPGEEQHRWLWLDPRTGARQRITGLDGWSGLGDQGGQPVPSLATPDPAATLSGWGTAGVPSPDGRLLPFERPTTDGRAELTVVDTGTGRRVQTWLLPQSDASGQWTAWQDDRTLLAATQPTGAPLTVRRLSVPTGATSTWRTFPGATAVTVAGPLLR